MLVLNRNLEIGKDQDDDKNIINTQGFFYDVTSKKLKGFFLPQLKIDKYIEQKGKENPKGCPPKCRFYRYLLWFTVEHAQIKRKHDQYKYIK